MSKTVAAVYPPPAAGLPFLAVRIWPSGKATGIAAKTAALAQEIVDEWDARINTGDSGGV